MVYQFSKSKELYERACKSIASGVNSGIRKMEQPVPLYFDRGEGPRVWDVDGNEYIDFQIGQGALLYGHAPAGMAEAIAAQARLGTHWAAQSTLEIEVAERLQQMIPSAELVRFNNSATEVVLSALRLARAHTGRPLVLKFEGHYHGWADEGLVGFAPPPDKWGTEENPTRLHPSQGVIPEVLEQFVVARWNDPEHLRRRVAEYRGKIAAIIFEPILCNTGCMEPVPGMMQTIRELCDQEQMLMISDETITGFRFGASCAQGYLGYVPDLTILGKAVGGGLPFAALTGKAAAMAKIIKGEVVHAGTLNGNPLCLAASKWCLDFVPSQGEKHPREIIGLGKRLMDGLRSLADWHGIPLRPQGPGLVFHAAMLKPGSEEGKITNYRDYARRQDAPRWAHLRRALLEEGVRAIERGLWFVSMAHREGDIDEALQRAAKAFARHAANGNLPPNVSKRRRVLFAGLFHETHTFVDEKTTLKDFAILRGEGMLGCAGDSSPLGGALQSAKKFGWEILPTVDFRASPSGMVADEVIEVFWREFESRAKAHVAAGVDAIYLVLHGAMVSETMLDVEGEMLSRIRRMAGFESVPIFGVFDLHANFTALMAEQANCLVAYRENPHTDAKQAADDAAALLEKSFVTGKVPRLYWEHPPIMWAPTGTGTASEPMLALEKLARQMEAEKELWAVNVVAGFSFADTPDTGVSFVIASTGLEAKAREKLMILSQLAMKHREQGNASEAPIETVFERLRPLPPGLTVLVEPSDNIGGGAPGDGTGILRALLNNKIENAAVAINDPESVAKLNSVSIGGTASVSIGGKGSKLDAGPVTLTVKLISRSDGRFPLEDKHSHLASMVGDVINMGPCAVVRHEGITILLTSKKTPPFDLGQWRSQGIEPTQLSVIGVKAAVAHRRAYDPIAKQMLWVNTPGPCSSDLKTLPFRHARRPIYPLDHLTT